MKSVVLLILGCLIFQSCDKKKVEDVDFLKSYLGDTIDFCELKGYDILFKMNDSNKILVFLDSADCTTCAMDNIIMWDRHTTEMHMYNLKTIVICNHSNPQVVNKYMFDYGLDYPILLDSKNKLKKRYRFLENEKYRTFVIDQDDRIIWIGSPLFKKEYWNSFCKMMELLTAK